VTVAALYDIHGNLAALEAVLAEVPAEMTILLGGDYVYGPHPAETLDRLRALGERAVWLRGNCDRELSEPGAGSASLDVLDWVRDRLTAEQISFLHDLPSTVALPVDGLGEVLFCHATPQNDVDFFTDITPELQVAPAFTDVAAPTVVCGHSHLQFERDLAGKHIVNPGSVGMAYEDEPGAYWALLGPQIELRRSTFAPAALAATGYPRPWPVIGAPRQGVSSRPRRSGASGGKREHEAIGARIDDCVYIHGSRASRTLRQLAQGARACLTVTHTHGLVLARSAFKHTVNYESVVAFGSFHEVDAAEELVAALRAFTEKLLPGRWSEVRTRTARRCTATATSSSKHSPISRKPPRANAPNSKSNSHRRAARSCASRASWNAISMASKTGGSWPTCSRIASVATVTASKPCANEKPT
jgi:nitroimidazol reductase NimA-like FMN-containing flavoprotein (pyridoxamine 5'-phosphate oxidase superfamily)/predicted phosphodiesterase